MAESVLTPPNEPPVYRPVAGLAIAGFLFAGLFALIMVVGVLIGFFRGMPLFLPNWVMATPLAGFFLSWLGARQIRNSEGTRAGLPLARLGLWLSVVCGLSYLVYFKATELAVTKQADDFFMNPQTGFFPLIKASKDNPKALYRALLLASNPIHRQKIDPNDTEAMRKHFDEPNPDGSPGFLSAFRDHKFVAALQFAGSDAHIQALAVKDWRFQDGGFRVDRAYRITTSEGVREFLLRAQSNEGIEPGESRQWGVMLPQIPEINEAKLTPLGQKIETYRRGARAFFTQWTQGLGMGKGFDFKDKDATRWDELIADQAQRAFFRQTLIDQFAKGRVQVIVSKEEDFIPWEKVDGNLRLTLRGQIRLEPINPLEPGYVGDLRVVLQAKDQPEVSERAIAWTIHQVYLIYGGAVMNPGKGKPG